MQSHLETPSESVKKGSYWNKTSIKRGIILSMISFVEQVFFRQNHVIIRRQIVIDYGALKADLSSLDD
jgi:hypothetical protein